MCSRPFRSQLADWARLASPWLLAGSLLACTPQGTDFHATPVEASQYGRDFTATDHRGQSRQLADYRGKVVTLFFGYTQCPDVCPTSLNTMREVMTLLGPEAERVQVLFLTVDPGRDTQELLAEYVPAFDTRFVGLRADEDSTARIARDFKVFYRKQGDTSGTTYTIDHTAGTYLFDPQGRLRLYARHGETPANLADDIRQLLKTR